MKKFNKIKFIKALSRIIHKPKNKIMKSKKIYKRNKKDYMKDLDND